MWSLTLIFIGALPTSIAFAADTASVDESAPFVSVWSIGGRGYGPLDLNVTLPLRKGYKYDFTVDWGDGSKPQQVSYYDDPSRKHTYLKDGDYKIIIKGTLEAWYRCNHNAGGVRIAKVESLGKVGWINLESAFYRCGLTSFISGNTDTSQVQSMAHMFLDVSNPKTFDISTMDSSNVRDMSLMFGSTELRTLDISTLNTSNVVSMEKMFAGSQSLTEIIGLSDMDTSSVKNMGSMLYYNKSLKTIDVSKWDVSNVTNMKNMFADTTIKQLKVSKWNVSNVTNMRRMFSNTENLKKINVSKWDVSNVTNMKGMFSRTAIRELNIDKWDVSNVTDMSHMFSDSYHLNYIGNSNWNTSNVNSMKSMFSNAVNLKHLFLSKWNISNVTDMDYMFAGTLRLETVSLLNWSIHPEAISGNMFRNSSANLICSKGITSIGGKTCRYFVSPL